MNNTIVYSIKNFVDEYKWYIPDNRMKYNIYLMNYLASEWEKNPSRQINQQIEKVLLDLVQYISNNPIPEYFLNKFIVIVFMYLDNKKIENRDIDCLSKMFNNLSIDQSLESMLSNVHLTN